MKRTLRVLAGISALVAGVAIAFAITPLVTSQSVVAGSTSVTGCDDDPGWAYSFLKNTSGQVSSVQISNIASMCSGGSMQVTLSGSFLFSVGTPTVLTSCDDTCAVIVPLTTPLLFPSQISATNALIVGP